MKNFSVDILTPRRTLAKDLPAESLLIPTERGEINPLPGHTHLISKLDTGILTLINEGRETHFSITGGILKILDTKILILSKVSESPSDIDKSRAEKALEKAKSKLSGTDENNEEQLTKYRRKLARAEIRLKMALMNKK